MEGQSMWTKSNLIYFPALPGTACQDSTSDKLRKTNKKYIKPIIVQPQNILGKYSEMPKHEEMAKKQFKTILLSFSCTLILEI